MGTYFRLTLFFSFSHALSTLLHGLKYEQKYRTCSSRECIKFDKKESIQSTWRTNNNCSLHEKKSCHGGFSLVRG